MTRRGWLLVLLLLCAGLAGCGGHGLSGGAAPANCPAPVAAGGGAASPGPPHRRCSAAIPPAPARCSLTVLRRTRRCAGAPRSATPAVTGSLPRRPGPAEWCISHFAALDAATGAQRWRVDLGGFGSQSSPAVADGIVYVGDDDGFLHALDAATGQQRWRVQTRGWIDSSPAVAGGVVYVGSDDGVLSALDAATGQERWRFATGAAIDSSPAVADGLVYIGSNDRYVGATATHSCLLSSPDWVGGCAATIYAVDAATGQARWRSPAVGMIEGSPAVSGGLVFIGDMAGTVHALDAATGGVRWRFRAGGDVRGSPAVANGLVIVGTSSGTVWALGAAGGGVRWFFRPASTILLPRKGEVAFDSSPTVAGGAVYVGAHGYQGTERAQTGALFVLDLASGQERWRALLGDGPIDAAPAVAGGLAFIYADYGVLYALGGNSTATRAADSAGWRPPPSPAERCWLRRLFSEAWEQARVSVQAT